MSLAVRRALLSCADKAGLEAFAARLARLGIELVASGGTAAHLARAGLQVRTIEAFAGITEQLDGRVKTLHPKIHAGILARRDEPAHVQAVGAAGLIDLVVVNLYPFERTIARAGASLGEALEQIDIGGVALLRAAAKNFPHVAVVCRPEDYSCVAEALERGAGRLEDALSRELAVTAFHLTSAYDGAIGGYLAGADGVAAPAALPEAVSLALRRRQVLRYGENPHQQAAWYAPADGPILRLAQVQGKELSYNNLLDVDAALRCVREFEEPAAAVVKHRTLCGLACAAAPGDAYDRAHAGDPESAFGGAVGLNRPLDRALAERLCATFLEVIVAPSVEPAAREILRAKANLRVLTVSWPPDGPAVECRQLSVGWLLQEPDRLGLDPATLRVATARAPTDAERGTLGFAWAAVKHVLSNGIVLAGGRATLGIGQGQPSRVGAVRLAIQQAGARSRGAVAASDGFFPFQDGVELLAKAGITAVIQPGGSIRDAEVSAAADAAGMAMLLTGVRHFRH